MLLTEKFKNHHIILGSGSPRRQQFIKDMGLDFEVRLKGVEEHYPSDLKGAEIAVFLAELKAKAYKDELGNRDILITGDTVVWQKDRILHKPKDREDAIQILQALSDTDHEVISSACITTSQKSISVYDVTKVYFNPLSLEEITFYVDHFKPYDKAGAYGIQEWIGKIGIEKIEGSFYTVMGMPVAKVYGVLKDL